MLLDEQATRELQGELEATVKLIFNPLKEWYHTDLSEQHPLRVECGEFPRYQRELLEWKYLKKVRKEYKIITGKDITEIVYKKSSQDDGKGEKKKRRWGYISSSGDDGDGFNDDNSSIPEGERGRGGRRRTRWGGSGESNNSNSKLDPLKDKSLSTLVKNLHNFTLEEQKTLLLRLKLDTIQRKLLTVVADAKLEEKNPNRSPSPQPTYDSNGKRTNTREIRMRKKLLEKQNHYMEELLRMNPCLRPAGAKLAKLKRKVYIPQKDFPNYNFIGLILGPRGLTQKRLEAESGASISIRGRGSMKEGREKRDTRFNEDMDDELHVCIQGTTLEEVEKAVELVEALLKPLDDSINEHKQKQLRELALINGTLREQTYCTNCGEPNHRSFDCPKIEQDKEYKMANVRCGICGDGSHPTSDCPMKNKNKTNEDKLDSEFSEFMQDIGEQVEEDEEQQEENKEEEKQTSMNSSSSSSSSISPTASSSTNTISPKTTPPPTAHVSPFVYQALQQNQMYASPPYATMHGTFANNYHMMMAPQGMPMMPPPPLSSGMVGGMQYANGFPPNANGMAPIPSAPPAPPPPPPPPPPTPPK